MLVIFDVLPPVSASLSRPWTAVYVLAASVAQCAAVTILFGATRVAPQYWPLGTGDPLLFSASAHGVSAVWAISPPTIRVCGGSGAGPADAVATAPSDAAVSAA